MAAISATQTRSQIQFLLQKINRTDALLNGQNHTAMGEVFDCSKNCDNDKRSLRHY